MNNKLINILDMINVLVELCIWYYKELFRICNNQTIYVGLEERICIANYIYNKYMEYSTNEYIYDIKVCDGIFSKQYIINLGIDITEIKKDITEFINRNLNTIVEKFINGYDINIFSISNHPLELYINFDLISIKYIINFYKQNREINKTTKGVLEIEHNHQ